MLSQIWAYTKRVFRCCRNWIVKMVGRANADFEEMVPSQTTRFIILAVFVGLDLLIAYIIALFDVGIWNGTSSVFGMIGLYFEQQRSYPFCTWLIFTLLLVVGVYIFLLFTTGDEGRNFEYSESNVYGSAREISDENLQEVAEVKPIEALSGTILGQLDMTGQRVIGIHPNPITNKNLIIFGTPGVGKSFSIVRPLIAQAIRRGESVVCTDTKYEVRAETMEMARRYGYTVRFFDLKDLLYSHGLHILKELRCDDVRAMTFAEIVMKNTGNLKDPHIALEQSVLRACCLYVERSRTLPENEKTFYTAYSMILQGPEALDKLFETAKYDTDLRVAYDAYASFKGSENLRGNVIANLSSRLQVMPTARVVTSTDDIDLTLPGRQKCIYYCCMSDMHETMKFLATLFFSFLFLDLVDYADAQPSRRLPVPVNVVLEEAANIGEIVGLEKYLSTARSRSISITMILQGIGQLRSIYGEETTNTILNDCAIHGCIGTNDEATAKHFEWFSGEATVKVKTEQHEKYEGPFPTRFNHSTGDGRRHVYTSNEIRKIKRGYILLGWQGYDTKLCHTFGINQHPEFKNGHMPVMDPHVKVPLSNTEAQAFIRAYENQRVADYEAWEKDGGNAWEGYEYPKPKYNGPSRNKPMPKVIPYGELEQMALEHAERLASGVEIEMLRQAEEIEKTSKIEAEPVSPPAPIFELPSDWEWEEIPVSTESFEPPITTEEREQNVSVPPIDPSVFAEPLDLTVFGEAVPVVASQTVEEQPPQKLKIKEIQPPASNVVAPEVMPDKPLQPPKTKTTTSDQNAGSRRSSGTLYGKSVQRFLSEQEKKAKEGKR